MTGIQCDMLDRLQRHCSELENQLALERQKNDAQLGSVHQKQADQIISHYKQRVKVAEEGKQAAEDENRRLRGEVLQLSKQVSLLSNELKQRGITSPAVTATAHVDLLQEQLKQFQLDFESERRDRLQLQATADDLLHQLMTATRQLELRGGQDMSLEAIAQRRQASLQRLRYEYELAHPGSYQHDGDVGPQPGVAYDEVDGPMPSSSLSNTPDLTLQTRSSSSSSSQVAPDVTNCK